MARFKKNFLPLTFVSGTYWDCDPALLHWWFSLPLFAAQMHAPLNMPHVAERQPLKRGRRGSAAGGGRERRKGRPSTIALLCLFQLFFKQTGVCLSSSFIKVFWRVLFLRSSTAREEKREKRKRKDFSCSFLLNSLPCPLPPSPSLSFPFATTTHHDVQHCPPCAPCGTRRSLPLPRLRFPPGGHPRSPPPLFLRRCRPRD